MRCLCSIGSVFLSRVFFVLFFLMKEEEEGGGVGGRVCCSRTRLLRKELKIHVFRSFPASGVVSSSSGPLFLSREEGMADCGAGDACMYIQSFVYLHVYVGRSEAYGVTEEGRQVWGVGGESEGDCSGSCSLRFRSFSVFFAEEET